VSIDSNVLSLAASLTGTLNNVKANDGSGGQWPPHGEHDVQIIAVNIKTDKVKYGPKGGATQESDGILISFDYRKYWDKNAPGYDPKHGEYLDFRGSQMILMPGWERLPEKEQTRFRMGAERLIQAATVLLGLPEDQCKNPVAILPKLAALQNTMVTILCEWREDQKEAGKFYKTDYVRELLNGTTQA
jgi:hypothetical protein